MHATIHTAQSPRTLPLRHCPLALALAAALIALPVSGLAQVSANQLPTGGSVAGGTGVINDVNGATRVVDQTSSRLALTWSAFDIGSAATMTFNQPSTNAVVLNLVQGGNPTQIFGNLTANGQVFLLNSNGVLLGGTANINVGGLVISTLGTSVSQFMNGDYTFDAGANTVALISNSGTINAAAGSATLIGGRVANSGTITATAGNITLAGADAATLTFESGGFGVLIDKPLQLALGNEALDNSGTLSAPGGAIRLEARAARSIFDRLINNSGTIRASSLGSGPDGSVSLVANGGGSFDVVGGGSIDAGTGAITLSTGRGVQQTGVYTAGSLDGFIGGNATFSGANKVSGLGNLDVGGDLSLTNTVALSQSGSLAVTGTSQFLQAGHALSLTSSGNTFGGLFSANGNGIAVNAAGNLSMGTLNLDSNSALSLSAGGVLTLPTTAINTGSANLTLSSGGSLSTRAALAGTNVELTGNGGIALAHDVDAAGTLKLTTSNSAITQSAGRVVATGLSTISAGTGAITLDGASNNFQSAVTLTGGNTRITDNGALTLGTVSTNDLTAISSGALNLGSGSVGGALSATSNNGAITQSTSAGLTVIGTSALNAGSGAITLTTASNDFGQAVSLTGGATQITDSNALTLGTLSTGNLTATSSGALNLGSGTVSGALLATSNNNAITQSGSAGLTVVSTGTLNAGSGAITLTTAGNNFQQAVSLTGGATQIGNSGALTLGTLNTGDLTATSTGALNLGSGTVTGALLANSNNNAITQSLSTGLNVIGTSSLTAGTGAITLTTASNNFQQAVNLAGGATQITDSGALTLGTLNTGNLTATSSGALNLGSGSVGGALLATSNNNAITQSTSNGLNVVGTSTLQAGTGAITLSTGSNDFGQAVSLAGGVTQIADAGQLTLGTLNTGNLTVTSSGALNLGSGSVGGALLATSNNNAITQSTSNGLNVVGTSTLQAGTGAITLTTASNNFQQAVNLTSGNTRITDNGDLTLGALSTGNLTATSNGALNLGSGNVTGTLDASSGNGAISQTAGLIVDAAANLNAGSGSIALANSNNDFRNGVSLTGTGISVRDRNDLLVSSITNGANGAISLAADGALTLPTQNLSTGTGALTLTADGGALSTPGTLSGGNIILRARDGLSLNHNVSANGNLALNASNGTITQSAGVLDVVGLATVDAGSNAITLDRENDFKNGITLNGRSIAVVDANDLNVLSLNNGGVGSIALTARNALTLPVSGLTSNGTLALRADNGTLALGGDLVGNAVSLISGNALTLGSSIDSNTLLVSTNNSAINQTAGALRVVTTSSFNTGTGAISLGSTSNHFGGAVSLTGNNVSIRDSGALTLGTLATNALTVASTGRLDLGSGAVESLNATSGGNAIIQTGALTVRQDTTLVAGGAAITLDNANNDFQGGVSLTGAGITVRDSNNLTLSALTSNNGGNIALTAGGNLTLPGTTLDNGSGDISLIANSLSLTAALLGDEVSLRANTGLTLGQNITARTLSLNSSNAAITQSGGALVVSGATTVDAGTGAIAFLQAGNNFNSISLTGNGIGVIDSNNLSLTALTSTGTGNVAVTAGGTLSLPAQTIALGSSNLTLTSSGGALSTGADLSGNSVTLVARDGLTLGHTVTANTLDLRSTNAAIVQNAGALNVVGTSSVDAGSASIALNSAGNRFGAGISLTGTGITVADSSNLTINALNAGANGTIALTAGGALNLSAQNLDTGAADLSLIANGGSMSTGGNLRGRNVTLSARDGLSIGHSITTTDALSLSSGNTAITQTAAALTVGTTTSINAGSGNVTLDNAANAFTGVVNLTAGDARIAGNALTFGTLSTDALTANSNGALHLGSGVVRGALNGTSGNAAITQSGALSVGGASTLNAGSGDIALTDANNDFVGAVALSGNVIALQDRNDLSIAAVQSGANAAVSLVAGGGLNLPASQIDTGTGALTLTANGGTLRTAGTLRGGDVQLTGANGIALSNTLTATNALSLNSTNAAITQTGGALLVAGNTTVNAGSAAITLDAAGNDFQGLLALSGGTSSVRDANALTLGTLSTGNLQVSNSGALNLGVGLVNGDLDAASNGGAVTQSGALTVTGSTRINSGGAAIALNNADNDFQAAVSLSGGNASVRDRNALALGNVDVGALDVASGAGLDLGQGRIGGTLVARSGGAASATPNAVAAQVLAVPAATAAGITQQGALTVVGSSVLDAGNAAIVLTDAGNDFQGNLQARGSSIAIVDRNDLAASAQASDALRLQAGGQLATTGTLNANDIALRGGTGIVLGHDVGGASVALTSGGAITQSAGSLRAGQLSGSAAGAATLTGSNNAIDVLGDFSAQGLDLVSNRTLLVSGRVDGGPSLRLRSGGELQLSGQLSGATSWLQAVAGIRQRAGSTITADLLSGNAGGPVVLGDAAGFIDNRVVRLGDFTASNGFSFTNGGDLLLVLANGSSYSVDAGNSAMFLSVRGNLFQDGRAPLRNGTGTFAATGQIGTQQNPLYIIGIGTQTVAAVGAPPAYFNATTADGGLLDLAGGSGFNVPTSAFASRAQSSASRTVAFVDLSASGTPYRAFGLVRPGLRLPDDQQPACDDGDPDAVCTPQ